MYDPDTLPDLVVGRVGPGMIEQDMEMTNQLSHIFFTFSWENDWTFFVQSGMESGTH